jgi:hypothetical protein
MNIKKCGFLLFMIGIIALACSSGTRLQDYEAKDEQEKEIKSLLVDYVTARNNYDVQKMAIYLSEDAKIGSLDGRTFSKSEFASTFKARDFESWGKYDCFDPDIKISGNFAEIKMRFKESWLNRGAYRFRLCNEFT